MAKADEINYINTVSVQEKVSRDDFAQYLFNKPYSDPRCWEYLIDIGQILSRLPPKPARILDLGCGSGWTTEIFAKCGYEVVGVDISEDFVKIAQMRPTYGGRLSFTCHDFEGELALGNFDGVVIFDALHHADDPAKVIARAHSAINAGGSIIIMEPGAGHSKTEDSMAAVRKYGTSEHDMPFSYFAPILTKAGFKDVKQFIRVRQLSLINLSNPVGPFEQIQHAVGLAYETALNGLTSLATARK
jgi:2-polyprenyl-3-methyl-5-hydroxy-6-metoxy-1,4-benzoquinol methylase